VPSESPKAKPRRPRQLPIVSLQRARALWIEAQRLTDREPFGAGPEAVHAAIHHLGYVQIDTINVIERCHHHILYNRIPAYRRADLAHAQSVDKTVFEYWTHALSYLPVEDFGFYAGTMSQHRKNPAGWGGQVTPRERRKILNRVRDEGALAISDIKDDKLVDKYHPWASRKPSKSALQAGFYNGQLVISRREGMLKTYELTERHFGWDRPPKPASTPQILRYVLNRALTAQGLVGLESICFNNTYAKPVVSKPDMVALLEKETRAKRLMEVQLEGAGDTPFWLKPEDLQRVIAPPALTHILSPFDPLIIQRKRTEMILGYAHLFEAYIPPAKRQLGYFTLPVLHGDEIVAALDLKADRQTGKLLIQAWHWVGNGEASRHKSAIEEQLDRFAAFQFGE
jgi:uncharacterized protein